MLKSLTAQLTPDSEGVLVGFMVYLFGINWKSSLSGLLSFFIGTFGVATTAISTYAVLHPQSKAAVYVATMTGISTFLSSSGKLWVGLISQDSGTQAVKLPNVEEPVGVPAHEVPNQPLPSGAKVVKES